jgi:hypothetical protein
MLITFLLSRLACRPLCTLCVVAGYVVARLWQVPWHAAGGRVTSAATRPVRRLGGW